MMMKLFTLAGIFIFIQLQSMAQATGNDYDSVLAKKLNADQYGMRQYYLVILKKGTADIKDKAQRDSIFGGHMKNIQRLAAENKLVVAGPFDKNDKDYEGIFILNTDSQAAAEQMVAADPALQSKLLSAEFYGWYGSAALLETPGIHKKIQREHF